MPNRDWSPLQAILEAVATVAGRTFIVMATSAVGFCCGYWIGHREVMGATATLEAMAWVPVVWLGQPTIFIAYAATGLAIFLSIHVENRWLYPAALIVTFITWVIVVADIVEATSHGKLWRW
jgi:hypothetical protein